VAEPGDTSGRASYPDRVNHGPTSIRLVEAGDAEALTAHLARDADAFERWEPFRPAEFFTLPGQQRRIGRLLEQHRQGGIWPGVILAGPELIGQVTVQNIEYGPVRGASLGYWVATIHQGRGHATRAVALALDLMTRQLRLHRATANTQLDNVGSQHVLRNNGFSAFGVAHSHILLGGLWRDAIMWERLLE
jgi:[ribosomal protein S5]-alanine N-acetyltransferase